MVCRLLPFAKIQQNSFKKVSTLRTGTCYVWATLTLDLFKVA